MTRRILTAMLAIVMLMSAAACAETLRVGMECNYAPYNWTQAAESADAVALAGGGYADGYDVRIAKRICEIWAAIWKSSRPNGMA